MARSTITPAQQRAITDCLAEIPHLAAGMGTEDAPCSIAAINRALTGEHTHQNENETYPLVAFTGTVFDEHPYTPSFSLVVEGIAVGSLAEQE